jgi:catalase
MPDLLKESAARDFVADAFAHCKFIGYATPVLALMKKAGIEDLDEGTVELGSAKDIKAFVAELGKLRVWAREPSVKIH